MMPAVVLIRPRFPENIGMAARACANMGCRALILVQPERWDRQKAEPLATTQGLPVLDELQIFSTPEEALGSFQFLAGTTARLGGWRREVLCPEEAAQKLVQAGSAGQKCALLFGSEDRGLSNEEISHCHFLVHIPTTAASSLNLAQAVLILLYECLKAQRNTPPLTENNGAWITHNEQMRLEQNLKTALLKLDCLHGQNPDYFFCQWQHILRKARLRPHEYACLMGFIRQINNHLG